MKPFWRSRLVWVNALALVAAVLQAVFGTAVLPVEAQGVILTVLNIFLRFRTDEPITLNPTPAPADAPPAQSSP